MDKITSLPESVIDLILERLPFIDRVRTSTLSRSWRLRWTHQSSLPLEYLFYNSVRKYCRGQEVDYANIINSLLLQHNGFIQEISLYIPEIDLPCISLFENSICCVSMCMSIETLYLEAGDGDRFTIFPPISRIFSLVNLRHLKISYFQFCPPPWFEGFPNLRCVEILSFSITVDIASNFLSTCPQLEEVIFSGVWFPDQDFELKAPKLRFLRLCGNFKDICVSSAPNLKSVNLWVMGLSCDESSYSLDMFKHINSLALVEEISLNCFICKLLGRCSVIHRHLEFNRMKRLEFKAMVMQDADQLQCVLRILASSPNIEELTLGATYYEEDLDVDAPTFEWMVEKYIRDDFRHLRKVEYYLWGTKTDLKIIERLLRCSPALEVMVIKSHFIEDVTLRVINTMKNLHRKSNVKFEIR